MSTTKALIPIGILAVVAFITIIVIQYRSRCKLPDKNTCPVGEQGELRVPFCDPSGDLAVQCKDATDVCGTKSCPTGQIATTCDYKNKKWVCKDSSAPGGGGGTPTVKSCDVNDKGLLPYAITTDGKKIPDINNFTPTLKYKSYKEVQVGNEAACMLQSCSDGFFTVNNEWCQPGDAGSGPCDTSKFKQLPGDPHKTYPDPNAYFINAYASPGDIKYCAYQRCADGYSGDPCVRTSGACPDPSTIPQAKTIIRTAGGQCVVTECNDDATFMYSPSSDGKSCEKSGCVNPKRKLINGICSPDCDDLDTRAELVFGSKRGIVSDDCLKNAQVQLSADGSTCIVKPGGDMPYGYCGNPTSCPTWFVGGVGGTTCVEGAEYERARVDTAKGCLECPPFYCKAGTTDQTMSIQTCHGFVDGCVYASGKDAGKAEGAVNACVTENSVNGIPNPNVFKNNSLKWGSYVPGVGISIEPADSKKLNIAFDSSATNLGKERMIQWRVRDASGKVLLTQDSHNNPTPPNPITIPSGGVFAFNNQWAFDAGFIGGGWQYAVSSEIIIKFDDLQPIMSSGSYPTITIKATGKWDEGGSKWYPPTTLPTYTIS